jgi:hypothetical protein
MYDRVYTGVSQPSGNPYPDREIYFTPLIFSETAQIERWSMWYDAGNHNRLIKYTVGVYSNYTTIDGDNIPGILLYNLGYLRFTTGTISATWAYQNTVNSALSDVQDSISGGSTSAMSGHWLPSSATGPVKYERDVKTLDPVPVVLVKDEYRWLGIQVECFGAGTGIAGSNQPGLTYLHGDFPNIKRKNTVDTYWPSASFTGGTPNAQVIQGNASYWSSSPSMFVVAAGGGGNGNSTLPVYVGQTPPVGPNLFNTVVTTSNRYPQIVLKTNTVVNP